ncbi:type IV conjugative transfer system lipoprotein TraV [Providencia sp. PROV120]|uniref:type IV conjugative transfer system lipoprotein TraV n=1 Tax=Providencia sp. PROV120 TaxID=2949831 RepID=UPI00234959BE|nr:type IV conjugative transfer system lipoprotein TraV [Providencia sp. PROV120]
MKKLLILGGFTLLAGCTAGMKDSFDCNATAQDSCLTMEEANLKAQQSTPLTLGSGSGGTPIKRPELPRLVPMATTTVPAVTQATSTSRAMATPTTPSTAVVPAERSVAANEVSPTTRALTLNATPPSTGGSSTAPTVGAPAAAVTWPAWGEIGMAPPVRLPTTTARLWIAPWVDDEDTLYQPAVVSFVVKDGQWKELLP